MSNIKEADQNVLESLGQRANYNIISRSSHWNVFCKNGVLEISSKILQKYLWLSLYLVNELSLAASEISFNFCLFVSKYFSNELSPLSFKIFMTRWKSLAPWVLLLEQELYLLYINSDYTNLEHKSYTTIFKNYMQKILNAITDENQSVATKNRRILHLFSTTRDVIDVPLKLILALISLNFCWLFTE